MKISKIVLILFSCLVVAAIVYQIKFGKQQKDENILIVGTSLDYNPYEFIDQQTGQAAGLDIDIVTELADRVHKKLVIIDMPFTQLILSLLTGEIDMIAAGISPTERRAKLVLFSDAYLQGLPFVVVTKTSQLQPENMQDLQAKVVAVCTGYITDLYMSKDHPTIELVKLDSPANCFLALQTGTVDAFVTSPNSATEFLKNVANPKSFSVMPIPHTGEICAFAVAKNDRKLLQQINQVLEAMNLDGALEKIKQKWGF
jgi:ABC-type amino acid transport substrate-binding protein